MRRIVFTNDKGGVGKTTTVVNLAVGVSMKGKKTLVVDMDPQADATFTLLAERPPEASRGYLPPTAYSLLTGHYSLKDAILNTPRYPNLHIIPANADLADAALKIAQRPTRLLSLLQELPETAFDVVLIDTGKGLDPLAINALAAAVEVYLMIAPGRLELDAIARMVEHVRLVREEVLLKSKTPAVKGIVMTLTDPYSITRDTWLRVQQRYPSLLSHVVIPKNNDLQKAIGRAKSVFEVSPKSKGAQAYQRLIQEMGL
jgi:chromosome partitioning protein